MASLNKVFLIGRLGQDPEVKQTQSGHSVANASLATSEFYKDQSGNKQEKTEWHRLTFWNRQAEIVCQYCRRGSQLHIEGSLQTDEWEKDGVKRQTTKVVVRNFQMLDSKPDGQQSNSRSGSYSQPQPNNQHGAGTNSYQSDIPQGYAKTSQTEGRQEDFVEDDIPF